MVTSPDRDPLPVRPVWIVGVLGHRRLGDPTSLGARIEEQLRQLASAIAAAGGELHVYVSAAAGTDLLTIRAARVLGLPVHILLPLDEAEFLKDFAEAPEWLPEARAALAEARAHPQRDSVQVATTTGQRPGCYFDTDARIVEGSDVVVAVWNGTAATGLGGTGQTVPLAQARGRPVLRIDPATLQVERIGFPSDAWPAADETWEWLLAKEAAARQHGDEDATTVPLKSLRARLSAIAYQDSASFRSKALRTLQVTAVAGMFGLVNCLLTGRVNWLIPLAIAVSQSVLLLWASVIKSHLKHRKVNDDWIRARMGTEIWRGIAATYPAAGAMHPIAGQLLPQWRRFAVTVGIARQRRDPPLDLSRPVDLERFKSGYQERLNAQVAHFEKQRDRSKQRTQRLPVVARNCTRLAPWFVGLAILLRASDQALSPYLGPDWANSLGALVFTAILPAALPLGAATATALVSKFDHDRRASRYDEMLVLLRPLLAELPHLHTADSVRAFVERCEELFLKENMEWAAAQTHVEI